jgi:hypothetical protein
MSCRAKRQWALVTADQRSAMAKKASLVAARRRMEQAHASSRVGALGPQDVKTRAVGEDG